MGLDLNGWRDHACRDWAVDEADVKRDSPIVLDGGVRSVIVRHDSVHVGGPEAILSPIGRGNGWGEVGAKSKRRFLSDHWHALERNHTGPDFDADMRVAVRSLSQGARHTMLCIPDHDGFGEAAQKRLLSALTMRGVPQTTLIWRSVALVLGLLDSDTLPLADEGMRVACVIHGAAGLERQVLVLRKLREHPERLTPERPGPGTIVRSAAALASLLQQAHEAVVRANPTWNPHLTEASGIPCKLLFDDAPAQPEIVRRDNGDWIRLHAPEGPIVSTESLGAVDADAAESRIDADLCLVLSPLAARHRPALEAVAASLVRSPATIFVPSEAAARGASLAAHRVECGIPHYLDRLDPIAMAVMRRDGPVFENLIPAGASVPGNREYVSEPLRGFKWEVGIEAAEFYLRKGRSEIRRWRAPVESPPDKDQMLEVQLRQMPAQGWATLSITSRDWDVLRRAPIRLDWGALTPEPRTETEILDALRGPRPAVPKRVHYEAHIGLWDGSLRQPGLSQVLQSFDLRDNHSVTALRSALSTGYTFPALHPFGQAGTFHAISTDGDLPADLPPAKRELFARVLQQVADGLLGLLRMPLQPIVNNDALRCLTWAFAACPAAVRQEVKTAFRGGNHRFLEPPRGVVVVAHGLGRITNDAATLGELIPDLLARLPTTTFLAPLASMLSRPACTPAILTRLDLEDAAQRLERLLSGLVAGRSFDANYKYAQLSVAGLLRVREYQPWALTTAWSSAARALAATLNHAIECLEHGGLPRQLASTKGLLQYLATNEGRPDLLTRIDLDN